MNDISTLIHSLSDNEQDMFIQSLKKRNRRNDFKKITLFKLLRDESLSSNQLCGILYKNNNKTAYHALRKRLYNSIIDFIALKSLSTETTLEMNLIKMLIVSRQLYQQKKHAIAHKIITKAAQIATENYQYAVLNEVYQTQIQFAHFNDNVVLNDIIDKHQKNKEKQRVEEQLNIAYAKLKEMISEFMSHEKTIDLNNITSKILKEQNLSIDAIQTFKSLVQLIKIASIAAYESKNYMAIESFLVKLYNKILLHPRKNKNRYYHIQVCYLMANMYFRNKKFDLTFTFLNDMNYLMREDQKKYFNFFFLKYFNLLALTYFFTNDLDKAIAIAEKNHQVKHGDLETILDLKLSLVMYYFQKKSYQDANTLLLQFYHSDQWYQKKADIDWVIKKNLIDILLNIELNKIDLIESRFLSFKRKHFKYLIKTNQERVIVFIKLVEKYYHNPDLVSSEQFKEKIAASFEFVGADKEDIFVMTFFAWLKSKVYQRDLYTTTLNIIHNAQTIQ